MLNLSDINTLTRSAIGNMYSDLYKEVHGVRPRVCSFVSLEQFYEDYDLLSGWLDRMIEDQKADRANNWAEFLDRVEATKAQVAGCDTLRAVEIIAEAEDIDQRDLEFYGWEILEYTLNLEYNSIKKFLATN